jgi:hypothetical protein
LHNHFFHAEPQVYFMHLGGEGSVEKLAGGVKAAFAKVKEIRTANPTPVNSFGGGIPENNAVSAAPLAESFTATPQVKDGMLRVNFTGKQFAVIFNGEEMFTAEDETHKDAGKVGVSTKADSVTLFDDFSYATK